MDSLYTQPPINSSDGIDSFSTESFHWERAVSKDQLGLLIQEYSKTGNIIESCKKVGVNPEYIAGYHRADFLYFLPYESRDSFRVLDLGAGFGNITIPIAKKMPNAKVYAVDASHDILRLLSVRARKEGCDNIVCTHTDVFENENLPFPEGSFDLILMNGVLEWIGSGTQDGNPQEIQTKFLSYIRSLLKSGGTLYIGIEGRFFLGYFTKNRDPHTQLRFTSVVPRKIADLICKLHGRAGYRTYTYSYPGYLRLLKSAGFLNQNVETIYSVANYKSPYFLFSYRNTTAYRYAFTKLHKKIFTTWRNNKAYRFLYALSLEKFFAPGYLFLASHGQRTSIPLITYILKKFFDKSQAYQAIKVLGNKSDEGSVNFFLIKENESSPSFVLKVKRKGRFSQEHIRILDKLKDSPVRKNLVLPQSVTDDALIYPFVDGRSAHTVSDLKRAITFLKTFHETEKEDKNVSKLPSGAHVYTGILHGDFTLNNVIFSGGKICIIDFEQISTKEIQLFDLCSLLLHFYRFIEKVPKKELSQKILSEESVNYFKIYEPRLTGDDIRFLFNEFCLYQIKKQKEIREDHVDFFNGLIRSLKNAK